MVRHELEEYLRSIEEQAGYQHVYSPVVGKRELYELSGHWSAVVTIATASTIVRFKLVARSAQSSNRLSMLRPTVAE